MAQIDPTVQQINDLYSQQLEQQKSQLEAQRNKAVLEEQQKAALIAPKYTASKQSANVQSQIGAKNFAEYLAQRGMTSFGLSGQAELSRQNVLANQIQGYNTSQSAEELASKQNITAVNTAYQTGLTSVANQIGVSKADTLLQYAQKLRAEQAARNEQLRQEALAKEQSDLDWTRKTAEQQRQEQWDAQQAMAAWNRQIAEQKRQEQVALKLKKSKSGSGGGSSGSGSSSNNILTTTKKQTPITTTKPKAITTAKNKYTTVSTTAKNLYSQMKSNVADKNIADYLSKAIKAGDITTKQAQTIANELEKMKPQIIAKEKTLATQLQAVKKTSRGGGGGGGGGF